MDKKIIETLKEKLFSHYKDFQKENLFIDSEEEIINIYNHTYMDNYLNENKIIQIRNFILKYLLKHKQEGFFMFVDICLKLNNKTTKEDLRKCTQ